MSTRATHTRTHAQHHTNAHDLRVNDVVGGGVGVGATIATHASVKCITAQHNTPPPHTHLEWGMASAAASAAASVQPTWAAAVSLCTD
jgi:hypothetical protein